MEFSEFLTWETLASLGGSVALVVAVVQLLKLPLDKVWKVPTNYIVYAVSLLVMLGVQQFALGGLNIETGLMAAVNAVIVTGLAMTAYRQIIEKPEVKKTSTKGYAVAELEAHDPTPTSEAAVQRALVYDHEREALQTDEDDRKQVEE